MVKTDEQVLPCSPSPGCPGEQLGSTEHGCDCPDLSMLWGKVPFLLPLPFPQTTATQCQRDLPKTPHKIKLLPALTSSTSHYYWEKPIFLILTRQVPAELALATSLVLPPTTLSSLSILQLHQPLSFPPQDLCICCSFFRWLSQKAIKR